MNWRKSSNYSIRAVGTSYRVAKAYMGPCDPTTGELRTRYSAWYGEGTRDTMAELLGVRDDAAAAKALCVAHQNTLINGT